MPSNSVLILKNTYSEGPGTIEGYLQESGIPYGILEMGAGETASGMEGFNTLVVLGGPMAVYEIDKYPHLRTGSRLIREAINRDMKVLGICLGAQMVAYCLGASVYEGKEKEMGWLPVELTAGGLKDSHMIKLAIHPVVGDFWRKFKVIQWHGDTFDLPADAVLLASSEMYKNQAFKYRDNVYAFQFHIEADRDMIVDWFKNAPGKEIIALETDRRYEEYSGRARNFYREFFRKK